MEKPISRPMHGLADYAYVPLVALAPKLADFEKEKAAVSLCGLLSSGALAYTLGTKAEWGVLRLLPFKKHLAIDFSAGLLALAAPWLFGFAKHKKARNTFLAMGVISLLASSLTKPEEMDE